MDILRKILKKDPRTLIIADDGEGIWGVIAEKAGLLTDHHFPAGTDLKKVLAFGKSQKALRVFFLQAADVKELEVKLGADLSADERRSAIEYAASGSAGDSPESQRISFMDGMFHDFRSGILVSYFDTEEILANARLVRSMKMKFAGVTNFKQLLLAHHFALPDRHEDGFCFLLGTQGIAALPERHRLLVRNLPAPPADEEHAGEWKERIRRRLSTSFKNKRLCLYAPGCDERAIALLEEVLEPGAVEIMDWEDAIAGGALFFLREGEKLIHPALPPPKEKDPKASGTYIGLFFLLAALLSLGFLMLRNVVTKYTFERDMAAGQAKIDIVQKEKNALKDLEKQLAAQQEIFTVMKQKARVSRNFLLVLNLLARYPLQYSRITAVEERNNGIHIEGESVWQVDLSRFFTHFEGELSKYKLTLFSDGLSKDKANRIIFRSHVTGAERGGSAR